MKYLKKFKTYSINEEELLGKAKKFFTGYENKEEKEKKINDFNKALDDAEELVSKNPEGYFFNRENLEKRAKENNYRGGLRIQRGGRDANRVYIVYDDGATGFEQISKSSKRI